MVPCQESFFIQIAINTWVLVKIQNFEAAAYQKRRFPFRPRSRIILLQRKASFIEIRGVYVCRALSLCVQIRRSSIGAASFYLFHRETFGLGFCKFHKSYLYHKIYIQVQWIWRI